MNPRQQLDSLLANHRLAVRQEEEESHALQEARDHATHVEEAQAAVQAVAETVQQQAHHAVADIVTKCLKAVFGDEAYEFKINFSQRRGKTEADLVFVRDGRELSPVDAAGGGVLDLASLALRLAALVLSRPSRRKLLVLDEPARHLSAGFRPAVAELLESLSKTMGIQIIMVTHADELRVGKVIEL